MPRQEYNSITVYCNTNERFNSERERERRNVGGRLLSQALELRIHRLDASSPERTLDLPAVCPDCPKPAKSQVMNSCPVETTWTMSVNELAFKQTSSFVRYFSMARRLVMATQGTLPGHTSLGVEEQNK